MGVNGRGKTLCSQQHNHRMSLASLVREYLTPEESVPLMEAYRDRPAGPEPNLSDAEKNHILGEFNKTALLPVVLWHMFRVDGRGFDLLGAGTAGYVVRFTSPDPAAGFAQLAAWPQLEQIVRSDMAELPTVMAVKVQLLYAVSPYWEARCIREEKILKRLNETSGLIHRCTPRFYFGGTCVIPWFPMPLRFRLTFMDCIGAEYKTLHHHVFERLGREVAPVPECVILEVEKVARALWRMGVSHNDLSTRNILVRSLDCDAEDNIRLVDFGLSRLMDFGWRGDETDEEMTRRYVETVARLPDRSEQHGSNVDKLTELLAIIRNQGVGQ